MSVCARSLAHLDLSLWTSLYRSLSPWTTPLLQPLVLSRLPSSFVEAHRLHCLADQQICVLVVQLKALLRSVRELSVLVNQIHTMDSMLWQLKVRSSCWSACGCDPSPGPSADE